MNIFEYGITEKLVCTDILREKSCKPLAYTYHRRYKMNVANILLSIFLYY